MAISNRACFAVVKGFQIGHTDAVDKGYHFLQVVTSRPEDVYNHLSRQINETLVRNRQIFKFIINVVVLFGQQNLTHRGHTQKN